MMPNIRRDTLLEVLNLLKSNKGLYSPNRDEFDKGWVRGFSRAIDNVELLLNQVQINRGDIPQLEESNNV